MSAVIPLEHFYEWTPTQTLTKPTGKLPTMYDLPFEHPEDALDTFHIQQPKLLSETFVPPAYPAERRFVATDLYLYYDPDHTAWYKRPDWFAAVGVPHLYQGELRYSYVMWQEKVKPLIIVELLSVDTEAEDFGRTKRKPRRPPTKWEVYEQILKVPYYAVFSRRTNHFQLFQLTSGSYQEVSLPEKRFFLPEIQLGLGVWKGTYDEVDYQWLRWYDATGKWIPTAMELAVKERHRATQAEQRATQAEQRAEQLAAKLRELGIDPGAL